MPFPADSCNSRELFELKPALNGVIRESDDLRLIERTLAGDRNAFGDLILRYQDRLFGSLVPLLGSVEDARDVAQDACLLAYEKLASFRQEASFYSWLFRIAYNAAMTNRRNHRRRGGTVASLSEHVVEQPPDQNPAADPAHRLQQAEQIQLVQSALQALPTEYREVLVCKELEGMKYDEIAKLLGCPVGTVRSRIHRAREELRGILERISEKTPETL